MPADTPALEPELTPRQREILKVLVQEYTSSATPVGSSAIQQQGHLLVSSATIRNELMALEELDYVTQPHTSAGRVPTVRGYRYFVEQLMEQVELPLVEQRMIRHQFHQIRYDVEQWMKLTAAVLARTAQAASLVTPPRATDSRFKHMELIGVHGSVCLMVLVLQDGGIHQEMLLAQESVEQDTLSQLSNRLNAVLYGHSVSEIEEGTHPELATLSEIEQQVLRHIVEVMRQADRLSIQEIYRDGLVNILRHPEFGEVDRFRQVVAVLEQRGILEAILTRILNASGVQIIIGSEESQQMDDVSLVLSPYGVRGRASGVLGVVGPTRMPYARTISTVRYVAHLMSSLLTEVYGFGSNAEDEDPLK